MKTTVNRKSLIKALLAVKPVVAHLKNAPPALKCILLTAARGGLEVRGTDLGNTITVSIPADNTLADTCAVNCRDLLKTLRALAGDEVTLENSISSNLLDIMTGPSGLTLPMELAHEFPAAPVLGNITATIPLPADFLAHVAAALPYVAKDRSRIGLTGVCLEFGPLAGNVTATDGHIMYHADCPDMFTATKITCIVPALPLACMVKTKTPTGTWHARVYDRHIVFEYGNTTITSKLIEATYPNYRQVIPSNPHTAFTDKAALLAALAAVLPAADKVDHQVKVTFKADSLHLLAFDPDNNTRATQTVPTVYGGPEQVIGYNTKFLSLVLASIPDKAVKLEVDGPRSATILHSADHTTLTLIMPLRLNATR